MFIAYSPWCVQEAMESKLEQLENELAAAVWNFNGVYNDF